MIYELIRRQIVPSCFIITVTSADHRCRDTGDLEKDRGIKNTKTRVDKCKPKHSSVPAVVLIPLLCGRD